MNKIKRTLSLVLAIVLGLGTVPINTAFAEPQQNNDGYQGLYVSALTMELTGEGSGFVEGERGGTVEILSDYLDLENHDTPQVMPGTEVILKVTPNATYKFDKFRTNTGADLPDIEYIGNDEYKFTMPDEYIGISADFTPIGTVYVDYRDLKTGEKIHERGILENTTKGEYDIYNIFRENIDGYLNFKRDSKLHGRHFDTTRELVYDFNYQKAQPIKINFQDKDGNDIQEPHILTLEQGDYESEQGYVYKNYIVVNNNGTLDGMAWKPMEMNYQLSVGSSYSFYMYHKAYNLEGYKLTGDHNFRNISNIDPDNPAIVLDIGDRNGILKDDFEYTLVYEEAEEPDESEPGSDDGNLIVIGLVESITTLDVDVPLKINFIIDEERNFIKPENIRIVSNCPAPIKISIQEVTKGADVPNIVDEDTFTDKQWNNLNKRQTIENIALKLNNVSLASSNTDLGNLKSAFQEEQVLNIDLTSKYGKAWANKDKIGMSYNVVFIIEIP